MEDEIRRAKHKRRANDKLRSYGNDVLGKDLFVFERDILTRGEEIPRPYQLHTNRAGAWVEAPVVYGGDGGEGGGI